MELSALLVDEGLPRDSGWTSSSFAQVVTAVGDLEGVFSELLPNVALSMLQKYQFRAAWAKLQQPDSQATQASSSFQGDQGSWVESFAPKMEAAKISELEKFLLEYTSEILTAATMPSTRLLSQAAHQAAKKDFRWIAWKHRMTQEKAEEIMVQRPSKQARLEALSWSSILLDDPPTLEVGNANMGIHTIRPEHSRSP